jgi:Galactokinase
MIVSFKELYGEESAAQGKRYEMIQNGFKEQFGNNENLSFFSAPGRTEIGGNHTDHNHGRVLAAAVNLDIIAAVRKTDENMIYLKSIEYSRVDTVDITDLSKKESEVGKSYSLIRGICARCKELGYKIGGFQAYTTTNVLKGSGLSSSAAFEIVVITIISHLFNDGEIDPVTAAKIAQYAENVYFGKPSGLMDQMASSVGSVISIDFHDIEKPVINKIDFNLKQNKHALCIVDTGGNHADLTDEYASIPAEMKSAANFFGKEHLRDVNPDEFMSNIKQLRETVGDRAVLRSMHFFDDDQLAADEAEVLQKGDFEAFLKMIKTSGLSSETRLQNVFAVINPAEQGLSLALAVTRDFLGKKGACRVHGGGFAGTIQAFVPEDILDEYKKKIEKIFGDDSCHILSIRNAGGAKVEI